MIISRSQWCEGSSVGRIRPFQGQDRGFESHSSLKLSLFRAVLAVVFKFDWEMPLRLPENRRNTGLRGNRIKNRSKSIR